MFDREYVANHSINVLLAAVYGLLLAPEPRDPLDSVVAEQYMTHKEDYERDALVSVTRYARRPRAVLLVEMGVTDPASTLSVSGASAGSSTVSAGPGDAGARPPGGGDTQRNLKDWRHGGIVDEDLCCPITLELFWDPVKTPSGRTYEKLALLASLERKAVDPMTREPLTPSMLTPGELVYEGPLSVVFS